MATGVTFAAVRKLALALPAPKALLAARAQALVQPARHTSVVGAGTAMRLTEAI